MEVSNDYAVFSQIQSRQLGVATSTSILKAARGSTDFIKRLGKWKVLTGHDGCVNTIAWNERGDKILSGSDDCHLNIYDVWRNKRLESIRSGHRANIFSARFLPSSSDSKIVSCCGGGMVHYNEVGIETYYGQKYFNCHSGTTYELTVIPGDPNSFLTCGEDGTVRHFDLRVKSSCYCQECRDDILIERRNAITSLMVNPLMPYHLAVGCEDSYARIYDMRAICTKRERSHFVRSGKRSSGMISMLKPPDLKKKACRVTSLRYNETGDEILVSYCADYVYVFSTENRGRCMSAEPCYGRSLDAAESNRIDFEDDSSALPSVKRLRLRGDWSDTGPHARPGNEQDNDDNNTNSLMQRISEVFSRWLENSFNHGTNRQGSQDAGDEDSEDLERLEESENRDPGDRSNPRPSEVGSITQTSALSHSSVSFEDSRESSTMDSLRLSCVRTDEIRDVRCDGPAGDEIDGQGEIHRIDEFRDGSVSGSPVASSNEQPSGSKLARTNVAKDGASLVSNYCENDSATNFSGASFNMPNGEMERVSLNNIVCAGSNVSGSFATVDDEVTKQDFRRRRSDVFGNVDEKFPPVVNDGSNSLLHTYENPGDCLCTDSNGEVGRETYGGESSARNRVDNASDCNCASYEKYGRQTSGDDGPCTAKEVSGVRASDAGNFLIEDYDSRPTCKKAIAEDKLLRNEESESRKIRVDSASRNTAVEGSRSNLVCEKPNHPKQNSDDNCVTSNHCTDTSRPLNEDDVFTGGKDPARVFSAIAVGSALQGAETQDAPLPCQNIPSSSGEETIVKRPTDAKNDSSEVEHATIIGPEGCAIGSGIEMMLSTEPVSMNSSATESRCEEGLFREGISREPFVAEREQEERTYSREGPSRSRIGMPSGVSSPRVGPLRDMSVRRRHAAATRIQRCFRMQKKKSDCYTYDDDDDEVLPGYALPKPLMCYKGHRNARTMIKEANFWGDKYIVSGSDCGRVFIWDRQTADLVVLLEGDKHVVNCVQPHPFDPILATSGIDYDVKVWAPVLQSPDTLANIDEIVDRNEQMLKESRDTITVPASFMLRMLASLSRVRGQRRHERSDDFDDDDNSNNESDD